MIQKFCLSKIIRIKNCYLNEIWGEYQKDESLFIYFPEKFSKYPPPKDYFWKVFSIVNPQKYAKIVDKSKINLVKHKRIKENEINITLEAEEILKSFKPDDLKLLSLLNSDERRRS